MKTIFYFFMIIFFTCGCANIEESPIQGSWKLTNALSVWDGNVNLEYPGTSYDVEQLKMWSDKYFVFVGKRQQDTLMYDNYGGGKYSLRGNIYTEKIQYHSYTDIIGKDFKMKLEIMNDTLIQTWPLGDDGTIDSNNYYMEKYVRLD